MSGYAIKNLTEPQVRIILDALVYYETNLEDLQHWREVAVLNRACGKVVEALPADPARALEADQ